MHQRVCREANVMARSSAFGASFCMGSEISMGFNEKLENTLQDSSRDLHALEGMPSRARDPWQRVRNCQNVESDRFENCSFDIGDISNSSLQQVW